MKQSIRRLLALSCVCTLLVSASAMALSANEDAEGNAVDITVDSQDASPDIITSNDIDTSTASSDSGIDIPMIEPGDNRVDAPLSDAFVAAADGISTYAIADIKKVQIIALKKLQPVQGRWHRHRRCRNNAQGNRAYGQRHFRKVLLYYNGR